MDGSFIAFHKCRHFSNPTLSVKENSVVMELELSLREKA
jgi:hypothetical protein